MEALDPQVLPHPQISEHILDYMNESKMAAVTLFQIPGGSGAMKRCGQRGQGIHLCQTLPGTRSIKKIQSKDSKPRSSSLCHIAENGKNPSLINPPLIVIPRK